MAARVTQADDARIALLRHPGGMAADMSRPYEFMSTLRIDLYHRKKLIPNFKNASRNSYCLARDATPIDVRLRLHSDAGGTDSSAQGSVESFLSAPLMLQWGSCRDHDQPAMNRSKTGWVRSNIARSHKIKQHSSTPRALKAIEIWPEVYNEKEARRLGVSLGKVSAYPRMEERLPRTSIAKMETCMPPWDTESLSRSSSS